MDDDEVRDDDAEDAGAAAPDEPVPPPPATAAGRARAHEEEPDDDFEDDEGSGLTDDFEQVEAELSAEFTDYDTSEEPAEDAAGHDEDVDLDLGDLEDEGLDEDEALEEGDEAHAEDEASDGGAAGEDEVAPEPVGAGAETVEWDTLGEAERAEAEEAAHAGIAARAAASQAKRGLTTGSGEAVAAPAVAAAGVDGEESGAPPKRRMWLRFAAGAFVIVASVAAATSISLLVYLTDIAEGLGDDPELIEIGNNLPAASGGDPQTILIMGSDKRSNTPGDPGRSDTTMLLRIDPPNQAIRLLSLPRDLKTEIPGLGTDKLNAAYSYGGPKLTLETVQELLPDIEINHIVNVDFEGFYDAVNAIGCVYVDVDRHYYNPPESGYDDIDIEAGYTKLCGYRALDYVRYRHNDNDLVRGTRQQDFLREARQRIPPSKLFADRDELIDIFIKYTTSDVDDPITLLGILKTIVSARNAEVRQIPFLSGFEGSYVVSSSDQLKTMQNLFLANPQEGDEEAAAGAEEKDEPKGDGKDKKDEKKDSKPEEPAAPPMIDSTVAGQQYAATFKRYMKEKDAKLPIYYPTQLASNVNTQITGESRAFPLAGPDDKEIYRGYKFVVPYQEAGFQSYYGVSGVNWTDPPILANPSETREIDGTDYKLFYDGDRLRLVGWTTDKGAYWVINTLTRALSEDEMLAIATGTKKFD